MTYGRLDVNRPGSPVESYYLDKANVAIGRSSGNDIVIEATAISRYHASLSMRDGQVYIQDLESINGTYVDGERLTANEPFPLQGGEEIQVGEAMLIFHAADENPTQPMMPVDATRRIEYEQPDYRVEMQGPDEAVTPGAYVQALLIIHNLSEETDRYFIEIDGVPKEWVRLERMETVLDPGESARLMLSFKPLRQPDSTPGDYPFIVRVRSRSKPNQTVDAMVSLRVLPFSGFGIDAGKPRLTGDEALPVHVHNQGSAPLPLSFAGKDHAGALRFSFDQPKITLSPGQRLTFQVRIAPKRTLLVGKPSDIPFEIVARSLDRAGFQAAIPATYTAKPSLSGLPLALLVGGGGLLVLLALVALALIFLRPPVPPQILDFTASATQVVQGDTVTLAWAVQDAQVVRVEVDGEERASINPETDGQSIAFPMQAEGEHELTLVALNGDQEVRQSIRVRVYAPLTVILFDAAPPTLVRYIGQDVTFTWDVTGATRVRLSGLAVYLGAEDTAEYGPSGSRTIRVVPVGEAAITLVAEGEAGQRVEQTVVLGVENPTCAVTAGSSSARAGPSAFHAEVALLPADEIVVPDMRDGSGQWLRILLGDDERAWVELAALTCANFEPTALAVDSMPPTAAPTMTPTSTSTTPPTVTRTSTPPPTWTRTATPTALPSATPPPTWTRTPTRIPPFVNPASGITITPTPKV